MVVRRLKAIIEADDRASAQLRRTGNEVQGFGKKLAAIAGGAAAGTAAFQALQTAVRAIGQELARSIATFAKYEFAQKSQELLLRNTNQLTKESAAALKQQAIALTNTSIATFEQVQRAQNLALALGANTELATQAARAATNMAAALGVDVEQATRQVTRTLGGYAGELGEVIPELKDFTAEQLRAGAGIDFLNEKFAGFGEELAGTLQGQLNNVNSNLELLRANVGELITQLTSLTGSVRDANSVLGSLNEKLASVNESVGENEGALIRFLFGEAAGRSPGFGPAIRLIQATQGVLDALARFSGAPAAPAIPDLGPGPRPTPIAGPGFISEDEVDAIRAAVEALATGTAPIVSTELNRWTIELANANTEAAVLSEILTGVSEAVAALPSQPEFLPGTAEGIEEFRTFSEEYLPGAVEGIREFQEQTAVARQRLQQTFGQIGVAAVTQFTGALVEGALAGDLAFKRLFINLIRDLTAAIAKALILRAILSAVGFPGFSDGGIVSGPFGSGGLSPIPGAQRGLIVPGTDLGRDSQLIAARPGEAVLPKELTDFLLSAASGGGQPVEVSLSGDLAPLIDQINVRVRTGRSRLLASETTGNRITR